MVISMDRWKGKVAVVTGASAGIGAAIAKQLVDSGLKVVGLARRKDCLDELAQKLNQTNELFYPFKADLTKEQDILDAFNWIKNTLGAVHILINSAGITKKGSLIEGNTSSWKEVLDTNVLGLSIATRETIKSMRENNIDGHIIHINSVYGHQVVSFPNINIYPASKYAVTALTETLRQELNSIKSKIKITSISPGVVDTELLDVGGYVDSKEVKEMLVKMPMLESKDVSDAVIYVLSTPPHVQVHELIIKPVGECF